MTYEVELKFALADATAVQRILRDWQAVPQAPIPQADLYFRHPQRDFGQTDEALRIRSEGSENRITYKGPKLDPLTKTRREIEVPLGSGATTVEDLTAIWTILGFEPLHTVRKVRTPWQLTWSNRNWEIAFDEVAGLGNYVEIETLAEAADRDAARDAVLALAAHLQLGQPERRSYLELLLTAQNRG